MNREYGKIEGGKLIYAPDVLAVEGKKIISPFEEDYLKAGYMPIVLGTGLPNKEGYEIVETYRVVEGQETEEGTIQKHIERVQEYVKLPEVEPSQYELQQEAMLQLAKMQAKEITEDEKALTVQALHDEWNGNGVEYKENTYLNYKRQLYKVNEGQTHISQPDWTPDTAHSLFTAIGKPGEGTQDNPIKWVDGMIAEEGKYYIDEGVMYLCIENSVIGLYGKPKNLARYFKSV